MKNYCLPDGYVSRTTPENFPDEDSGTEWQIGAYDLALEMAPAASAVCDVGCGRARKLDRFRAVGRPLFAFDCAKTVVWLQKNKPWLDSRAIDLDDHAAVSAPVGSLVICCDVVEHLVRPELLLSELKRLRQRLGCSLVLSTPDRELEGCAPLGPPRNLSHVREWTLDEFRRLCESFGLGDGQWSHTRTDSKRDKNNTITGVFR